eukprot:3908182-Rhodomonas_salina.1
MGRHICFAWAVRWFSPPTLQTLNLEPRTPPKKPGNRNPEPETGRSTVDIDPQHLRCVGVTSGGMGAGCWQGAWGKRQPEPPPGLIQVASGTRCQHPPCRRASERRQTTEALSTCLHLPQGFAAARTELLTNVSQFILEVRLFRQDFVENGSAPPRSMRALGAARY